MLSSSAEKSAKCTLSYKRAGTARQTHERMHEHTTITRDTCRATTSPLIGNGLPSVRSSSWADIHVEGWMHNFHNTRTGRPDSFWLRVLHASEQKLTQPFESMTYLIQLRRDMLRYSFLHMPCAVQSPYQPLKTYCLNTDRRFNLTYRYPQNARHWRQILKWTKWPALCTYCKFIIRGSVVTCNCIDCPSVDV